MQAPIDNIVQHLFHQPSLQSVTVDELERMAQQHPYFAAAHFLLLKKMQDTDHPHFSSQLHKTTLYFNNPLWLQFLLQPETVTGFKVSETTPFITGTDQPVNLNSGLGETAAPVTGEAFSKHEDASVPATDEVNEYNHESFIQDTVTEQPRAGIMDVITDVFENETHPVHHEPAAENIAGGNNENDNTAVNETYNQPAEEIQLQSEDAIVHDYNETLAHEAAIPDAVINEEFSTSATLMVHAYDEVQHRSEESVAESASAAALMVQAYNEIEKQDEESTDEKASTAEIIVQAYDDVQTQAEVAAIEETTTAEIVQDAYDELQLHQENAIAENNHQPPANEPPSAYDTTEQKSVAENITAGKEPYSAVAEELAAEKSESADDTELPPDDAAKEVRPLFKTIIETPAAKHDLLFEPYHTVDYFASQGIKLSKQETESKDKLGRQLKSFTEWLKSMKKLPQVSIEKILSENEESKVMADAIHSIENKEIITEAMAEVFEKQGMTEKAVETYQKLSLLNPAKSAYFAAKIDLLKQ